MSFKITNTLRHAPSLSDWLATTLWNDTSGISWSTVFLKWARPEAKTRLLRSVLQSTSGSPIAGRKDTYQCKQWCLLSTCRFQSLFMEVTLPWVFWDSTNYIELEFAQHRNDLDQWRLYKFVMRLITQPPRWNIFMKINLLSGLLEWIWECSLSWLFYLE